MTNNNKLSWHDKENAELYHNYAQKFPMYKNTSRDLIEMAELKEGMVVVDLACGTGITTKEILKKIGESGKIYAVDLSQAMLDIAQEEIRNKNVFFIKSLAGKINEVIKEKTDRVVCNAAFWQMKMPKTLKAVSDVLKNDGKFVFNLSGQVFRDINDTKKVNKVNVTYLKEKMIKIATEEYGFDPEKSKGETVKINYDMENLKEILKEFFNIENYKIVEYERTIEDRYEFNKIPLMTKEYSKQLGYEKTMGILNKAYNITDKKKVIGDMWVHFVAVKK